MSDKKLLNKTSEEVIARPKSMLQDRIFHLFQGKLESQIPLDFEYRDEFQGTALSETSLNSYRVTKIRTELSLFRSCLKPFSLSPNLILRHFLRLRKHLAGKAKEFVSDGCLHRYYRFEGL